MFGQGCLPGEVVLGVADLCVGAGLVGVVEVDATGALASLLVPLPVELVLVGAAAAPAMPAAAPPVASAPATIVAPSILEMRIGSNLLESMGCTSSTIVGAAPNGGRTFFVGVP
jgi:hypothetical protein